MRIKRSSIAASSERVATILSHMLADERIERGRRHLALDASGVCFSSPEEHWQKLTEQFAAKRCAATNGMELYKNKQSRPDLEWKLIDITKDIHRQQVLRAGYRIVIVDQHQQIWASALTANTLLVCFDDDGWTISRGLAAPSACPPFPLTDIQHAYWLGRGQSLHLGGVSCHVYFEWLIDDFDIQRFERAWNQVIERHGMLRAHLTRSGQQVILATVPWYRIPRHDLRSSTTTAAEQKALTLRETMCQQVLDAEQWPLFRVEACQWQDAKFSLHIDLDLLAFDVQSFHIVLSEAVKFYQDEGFELPPLRYSFEDYQRQAEQNMASAEYAEAKAWWLSKIDTLPPPPQLPIVARPEDIAEPKFVRLQQSLAKPLWQKLKGRAKKFKLTHTAVLLAAFGEVLASYCERGDFTLNMTQFNRKAFHPDAQKIVGDFTSVLLVDCDLTERMSFIERATTMAERIWENISRSEFGGVAIIREMSKRQKLGPSATMPVVFTSLMGMDLDDLVKGADLLGEPVHLFTETPQIWLDHQTMVRKGALEFNWIYISDLFEAELIPKMFADYCQVLRTLAESEIAWTIAITSIDRKAEQQVLAAANATETPRRSAHIAADFLAVASEHPARTAIVTAAERLSYGELAKRVAGICQVLDETLGTADRQEQPILVHGPKGSHQIAASLAVVLSGRILVPTSVEWPLERIKAIAYGAQAAMVLSVGDTIDSSKIDLAVLPINTIEPAEPNALTVRGEPQDVAYVIFTSGSTGTPKGVAMQHEAVLNTLDDIAARTSLSAEDRVFGISALSFDLAIFDVFATFNRGAALVLPDQEDHKNSKAWLDLFTTEGDISIWNSVPQLLAMFIEMANERAQVFPTLRYVLLSGDWVQATLVTKAKAVFPQAEVISLGGATEAAIWSNWFDAARADKKWQQMPYGFPLSNQSYHVLDQQLRPRPIGIAGDLYIGGAGLAQGYWGQPQLTADAFIRHPQTGQRLYRTGDIGKYHGDGTLEFLGRRDSQVKLGGYRVELGEIEAVLQQHPQVKTAVAVVRREAGTSASSLACWVIPEDVVMTSESSAALKAAGDMAALNTPGPDQLASIAAFNRASEAVAPLLMLRHLEFLGFDAEGSWQLDQSLKAHDVDPVFHELIATWHGVLVDNRLLAKGADHSFSFARSAPRHGQLKAQITDYYQTMTDELKWFFADEPGILSWIFTPSAQIAKALKNPRQAANLMFGDGSANVPEDLYKNNEIARYLGQTVATLLGKQQELAPCHTPDQPFQVLEVGAGIGGLSHYALPVLEQASGPRAYHYTDVSPWFVQYAKEAFGDYGFLRPGLYDFNTDAESQGYEPEIFDAILASNSLHNAWHLDSSLRDLYLMLKPGGLLVMIEATRQNNIQLVTAAILEHAASSSEQENTTGLLAETEWIDHAGHAGFESIGCWPRADAPLGATYQRVLAFKKPHSALAKDEVLAFAQQQLPSYMVPKTVHQLHEVPLNANGKVDRGALAARAERHQPRSLEGPRPESVTEIKLAQVWSEVLSLDEDVMTKDSSFFELGGDSLLATQLAIKVSKSWRKDFAIQEIFLQPVLSDMALQIDALPEQSHSGVFFPMTPGAPDGHHLYLCHGSDGLYGPFADLAQQLGRDLRCFGLQASGFTAGEPVLGTLAAQAQRAIEAMDFGGKVSLAGWSMGASLALEIAYLLEQDGLALGNLMLIEPLNASDIAPYHESEYELWRFSAGDVEPIAPDEYDSLDSRARIELWRASLGGAKAFSDEEVARWVDILTANVNAIATQAPRVLTRTKTTVFWAQHSLSREPAFKAALQKTSDILTISDCGHHDILKARTLHQHVAERLSTKS